MSFRVTALTRPFVIECLALFSRWRSKVAGHEDGTCYFDDECELEVCDVISGRSSRGEVCSSLSFIMSCITFGEDDRLRSSRALLEKTID